MLIPSAAPAGIPAPGPGAPGPTGMPPGAALDAMLKLATIYRAEEQNPRDLLLMERVTTLLQQIVHDRAQAASRPLLGGGLQ